MPNPSFKCRRLLASTVSAILLAATMSLGASAQVTITNDNGSFGDNVLFNNNPPDGFHINGVLNSTNGTFNVNFDSTQELHAMGGQAKFISLTNRLNNFCTSLDPGNAFTEYIFNAFRDGLKSPAGGIPYTVTAFYIGPTSGSLSATFPFANGNNFVTTVTALPGYLLTEVCFSTPDLPDTTDAEYGIEDCRQNRIAGAQVIGGGVVPEGNSLAMLGLGGLPVLGILLRRRRSAK